MVDTLVPHGFFVEVLIGAETGHVDVQPISEALEQLTLAGERTVPSGS